MKVKDNRGFTLLEVIISAAILAIMTTIIYTFMNFSTTLFKIGGDQSDIQAEILRVSDFITKELRYMEDVELLNQSKITNIVNNHSFDPTKKYIYMDASGDLIFTLGGTSPRVVYGSVGSFTITFEPRGGSKVVYYNINGQYEGRKYSMDSEVLIMNVSSSGITSGIGPYKGVVLGPLSNAEAARVDTDSLTIETISGSSDLSNLTEKLVLDTTGINGSTITWSSSPAGIIEADGNINRPLIGQPPVIVTLTATVTNESAVDTRNFFVTVLPLSDIQLLAANPPSGTEQTAYPVYYFSATGGSGPYTFSLDSGFIPVGMSIGADGKFSGTPAKNSKGTYIFTVKVTDGVNVGTRSYTLVIVK